MRTMPGETTTLTTCTNCGFEASAGSDEWGSVDHPSLGTLAQCPECGSTDVHDQG